MKLYWISVFSRAKGKFNNKLVGMGRFGTVLLSVREIKVQRNSVSVSVWQNTRRLHASG